MSISALHSAVEGLATDRGAMVLSDQFLNSAVLNSLRKAAFRLKGFYVETLHPKVTARFDGISISERDLKVELVSAGADKYNLHITPAFELNLTLFVTGDPTKIFSTVTFKVPELDVEVIPRFTLIELSPIPPTITAEFPATPVATRDDAIKDSKIVIEDLLRVEGSFAYGTGTRLVLSALGKMPPIDLCEIFPTISFSGKLELKNSGSSLVVIPEQFDLKAFSGCPQEGVIQGFKVFPQNPTRTGDSLTYVMQYGIPQAKPVQKPNQNVPVVALYMPRPLLQARFGAVAPAVTYRDRDNGFIGYDLQLTAAIKGIEVSIDEQQGALNLLLSFSAYGSLVADIDLPTVGRVKLAEARFEMPENNGVGDIRAVLRLGIDSGARVLLLTEFGGANLGKAKVDIELFSKYLGMAGGAAAVYGLIIDGVLGKIISHNLPGLIYETIENSLNSKFFVLADFKGISKYLPSLPNSPMFSGNANSALMGANYEG